ncbi:MAG: hypothetical protein JRI44_09415 [Deltaproteobacteria bacterium]|nr:hypothetical protein [Deltaproteobacteria bacterium]
MYKDYIFWIVIGLLSLLHIDFWAWDKVYPIFFGFIPYHLWYDGILTISGAIFFFWWGKRFWPDPPEDLEN